MAKTLKQIKDEVAKMAGYEDWLEVPEQALFKIKNVLIGYDELVDIVIKKFANCKLEQAAESANMIYHCGHTKQNTQTKHHQMGADNLQVNKQSILNLREEV